MAPSFLKHSNRVGINDPVSKLLVNFFRLGRHKHVMVLRLALALFICAQTSYSSDSLIPTSATRGNACEQEEALVFRPLAGTIPLAFGVEIATDLTCDKECGNGYQAGEVLDEDTARALYYKRFKETRCQWKLADLDPAYDETSSHLWDGQDMSKTRQISLNDNKSFNLSKDATVHYLGDTISSPGFFRFTAKSGDDVYLFSLSKLIHNSLMLKVLLRKIGYLIPPSMHLSRLRVQFQNNDQLQLFKSSLDSNNIESLDRWILFEGENFLVIQDLLVNLDQEFFLDLSKGTLKNFMIEGRRLLRSLVIPNALMNVPENPNLMSWVGAEIVSDNVVLEYDNTAEFGASRDDAIWIMRRIVKLTESDWKEIVAASMLPQSVQLLIFEKVKSRRNHYARLFNVDNTNLPVNTKISNHKDLKNGRLKQEFYDGFSRRFVYDGIDNPLNPSELFAFGKSKALAFGLELLTSSINSSRFLGTNISKKIEDFQTELIDQIEKGEIEAPSPGLLPVKTLVFPTARGGLTLGRDIVAGTYLGTDNTVQLVDSLGVQGEVGLFGLAVGLYSKTGERKFDINGELKRVKKPIKLSGQAKLNLTRTYSHVRPIQKAQKAIKYPFKNVVIPLLKRNWAKSSSPLLDPIYSELTDEQKEKIHIKLHNDISKVFRKSIKKFNKNGMLLDSLVYSSPLAKLDPTMLADQEKFQEYKKVINDLYEKIQKSLLSFIQEKEICLIDIEENCLQAQKDKVSYFDITPEYILGELPKFSRYLDKIRDIKSELELQRARLENRDTAYLSARALSDINENINLGESIIITDSLAATSLASLGIDLYRVQDITITGGVSQVVIRRTHLIKTGEDQFHLYQSLGEVKGATFSVGGDKFIPVFKVKLDTKKGSAKTSFTQFKLKETEDFVQLYKFLTHNKTKIIKDKHKTLTIGHKFKESSQQSGLFIFRAKNQRQWDNIKVTAKDGEQRNFVTFQKGQSFGRDIENYSRDLIDLLISEIFNSPNRTLSFSQGNPGFTLLGRAHNKLSSIEVDTQEEMQKPFAKITRIFNGWQIKRKALQKRFEKINERYNYKLLNPEEIAQTEKVFLFALNLNFTFTHKAVLNSLTLSRKRIEDIFLNYHQGKIEGDDEEVLRRSGAREALAILTSLKRENLKQKKRLRKTLRLYEIAEKHLTFEGMGHLLDKRNFFVRPTLDGFRVDDPSADRSIFFQNFGRLDQTQTKGPLESLRSSLGIGTGEFYLYWLMGRII